MTLVALLQLHPLLLIANTTTDGGDTGAHVMLPAFMKSNLLPHGQLTGWDPDWYDGFPLYTFYFPLPGLITVLFNAVVPYNIAFKFVDRPRHAHPAGLRLGVRSTGRSARPGPGVPGRRHPSVLVRTELHHLRRQHPVHPGRGVLVLAQPLGGAAVPRRGGGGPADRATPGLAAAMLFAATLLCHLIPAIFAGVGAGVWLLLDADLARGLQRGSGGRFAPAAMVEASGLGDRGRGDRWWADRVLAHSLRNRPGLHDQHGMDQHRRASPTCLFPASARWVLIAADVVGVVAMLARRNRVGLFIAVMGGLSAAAVCLDPQGKLYNVRFLPLWFLCMYLMAGYALSEVVAAASPAGTAADASSTG